jgi:hypothetical protein
MRRKLVALLAAVALMGLLGGCAASRNGLSTHNSVCFRVIPEAFAAVHDHGHFAGDRYLPPRALILDVRHSTVPAALENARRAGTCLVAFTGHFTVSDVSRSWDPSGRPGRIAIVIIRQRDLALVTTVVLRRIPPRLVFARVFPKLH